MIFTAYKSPYSIYNWACICSELKDVEKRVEVKLSRIYTDNPNPIPYDRIAKEKQIGALSRALRQFIELENEKDATVTLLMIQGMGVKLKAVR